MVKVADLHGILEAMEVLHHFGWQSVIAEIDAQVVSWWVNQAVSSNWCHSFTSHWETVDYLERIIRFSSTFLSCSSRWAPRACNAAAHALCRWAAALNRSGFVHVNNVNGASAHTFCKEGHVVCPLQFLFFCC